MASVQSTTPGSGRSSRPRRITWGGCLSIFIGVTIALTIVFYIGYRMWSHGAAERVDDRLAELRAQGQPTTPEELDAYYVRPPEQEDVTALLLMAIPALDTPAFHAAAEGLPTVGTAEQEIPPPGEPWEERDAVRRLLDQFSEPLQQLHEAADKGGAARFPVEFEDGVGMLLEHTEHIRRAGRLLALEAHARAAEGDAHGAARSIRALLSLARSLENEPVVISQVVAYRCYGIAYGLIDELLPHVGFADEDLAMLQDELRCGEILEGARRALVGERVVGIEIGHQFGRGSLGATHGDLARYLETMDRLIEASEESWLEAQKVIGQAVQDLEAATEGRSLNRVRYVLSNMLLPALEALITAGARTDAARRVVDTAIATERYRREHHQPPPRLAGLASEYLPAVPNDPFDGLLLRYVLEDDEIVIYSIDVDGVDDGGRGDLSGEPDIVVRLSNRIGA